MEPGTWSWILESWVVLPVAALAVMLRRWWVAGRSPDARSVSVRYRPPGGLTPGEVGALRDGTARLRHFTATLLDLEARGHLEIEEVEPPVDGTVDRDFVLRPRTDPAAWEDLHVHERRVLHSIFSDPGAWTHDATGIRGVVLDHCAEDGGRDEPRMSELKSVSRALVGSVDFFRRLVERGLFAARPGDVRLAYLAGAVALLGIGIVAADSALQVASVVAAAAVASVGGWYMPKRTEEGARAAEKAVGFREFVARVEADRLEALVDGPEEFDRYLAYAVGLDVDNAWAPTFHDVYGDRWTTVDEEEAHRSEELAGAMVAEALGVRDAAGSSSGGGERELRAAAGADAEAPQGSASGADGDGGPDGPGGGRGDAPGGDRPDDGTGGDEGPAEPLERALAGLEALDPLPRPERGGRPGDGG